MALIQDQRGPLILLIGHRGASGYAPENTLLSFQIALDMQIDMIEFDVFTLPTGEIVLMHDDTVDRTTDGQGYVIERDFDELAALFIAGHHKVLTLTEALDFIDKRVAVNIELKNSGSASAVAQVIARYIEQKNWDASLFMVSSFDHIEVKYFKQLMPHIKTGANISAIPVDYAAFVQRAHADVAVVDDSAISQTFVDDAHGRGLEVYMYTNFFDDTYRVVNVQKLGADGMYVNFPDRARRTLQLPVNA